MWAILSIKWICSFANLFSNDHGLSEAIYWKKETLSIQLPKYWSYYKNVGNLTLKNVRHKWMTYLYSYSEGEGL